MAHLFPLGKRQRVSRRDRRLPLLKPFMSSRLKPVHPGDVLREDFMKPLGLSAYKVAKAIGVAPIQISQMTRGRRAFSAKTALLLGKYFRTSPELWVRLQAQYDLEVAEPGLRKRIAKINALAA
jgi:addiction module HigA family antidote